MLDQPVSATYAAVQLMAVLPELILVAAGCLALVVGQAGRESVRRATPLCAFGGIVLALFVLKLPVLTGGWLPPAGGGLLFDHAAEFVRTSALILGVMLIFAAWTQPQPSERGEFFAMMLFSLAGLLLTASARDLLVLFLALELVSIPSYVMVVLSRNRSTSLESGTKYFYLGAFSAAIMAYGFSFLYGVAGTASLEDAVTAVRDALLDTSPAGATRHWIALIGLLLGLGGLLFKIAAFPLHFYIADVYHGAAPSVAGFLGFVPKLAGMIAILRLVQHTGWLTGDGVLFWLLWIVAVLSMTIGNVLALRQRNLKRMLAYSGIAHSGYMLVGVLAGRAEDFSTIGDGAAAVLYYAVVYGIANLAAFAVLGVLRVDGRPCETVRDVAGLLRRHPGAAMLLALSMLTLMGMPPTPGFWGKLGLFGSALTLAQSGSVSADISWWIVALVVIGVVNSAIAAAYYLRVIAAVLLYESDRTAEPVERDWEQMGAILTGMMLLIFTFWPSWLMQASRTAAADFGAPPRVIQAEAAGASAVVTPVGMSGSTAVRPSSGALGEPPGPPESVR